MLSSAIQAYGCMRAPLTILSMAARGPYEVFHAHMTSHVYPMHTHESWTLLIVDDGMVRYDLHRHEHGALDQVVTLLPPHVPHNGRAATSAGFGKRVVYLDLSQLPASLIGQAVDQPLVSDLLLWQRIHQLHHALDQPGEEFEAENRLAFIAERLRIHLSRHSDAGVPRPAASVAHDLRDLINSLSRHFTHALGVAPSRYARSRSQATCL